MRGKLFDSKSDKRKSTKQISRGEMIKFELDDEGRILGEEIIKLFSNNGEYEIIESEDDSMGKNVEDNIDINIENDVDDDMENDVEQGENKSVSASTLEANGNEHKHLKLRIGAGVVAGSVFLTSGAILVKTDNFTAINAPVSQIESYMQNDNTAETEEVARDINQETIDALSEIQVYIKLSKDLDKLYKDFEGKIDNLSHGEVAVDENGFVFLTNEELIQLQTDVEFVNEALKKEEKSSSKDFDKVMQAIKRVVSKSSVVNAYLAYAANGKIFSSIMDNFQNDVASGLGLDFYRVTVTYDEGTDGVVCERNDNGTDEASYWIDMNGLEVGCLEDKLTYSYDEVADINDFLSSDAQSMYRDEDCLMVRNSTGGIVVYRNKDNISELNKAFILIKLMLCRDYTISDGNFRYRIFIEKVDKQLENEFSEEISVNGAKYRLLIPKTNFGKRV